MSTISKRELARTARRQHRRGGMHETPEYMRPRTRGECASLPRPCPYLGCRYHLGLSVKENGAVKLEGGFRSELEDMAATCALDVAAEGPHLLDDVAELLGITRERVRQLETEALEKFAAYARKQGLDPKDLDLPVLETAAAPPKDNDVLESLGFNEEETQWLMKNLSLSEMQEDGPSLTSMTALAWVSA